MQGNKPRYLSIPEELRVRPQWVCYRIEVRNGKKTKIPCRTEKVGRVNAKSNNPATWHTFEEVVESVQKPKNRFDGIGFMVSETDPYVFIDLDHVVHDGSIEPWAEEIVEGVCSYSEFSCSGSGIHIIARAKKPGRSCRTHKQPKFEIYDHSRMVVFTGRLLPGSTPDIRDSQAAVDRIYSDVFDNPLPAPGIGTARVVHPVDISDSALLERAMSAANGMKFTRLWSGDTSDYAGDDSAADMALCRMLAFWTQCDAVRMDRLFRQSGLMRDKWDELRGDRTYGELTVDAAIRRTTDVYSGTTDMPCRLGVTEETLEYPELVVNNRQLRDMAADAIRILESANVPPTLFVRSGTLCQVIEDEHGNPAIRTVTEQGMMALIAKSCNIVAKKRDGVCNVMPQKSLASYILCEGEWPFPPLEAITRTPTIRPDGTISQLPGYDPKTRLFYHQMPREMPVSVPEKPTSQDVQSALSLIDELLIDFPFDCSASRANAIAMLLSPILQPAIRGVVPLFLTDAPTAGTGKSLLASVAGTIASGALPDFTTAPARDEEWPKKITAILSGGPSLVVIDNVKHSLESGDLAALLTAMTWKERVFGKNTETIVLPNRAIWVVTGNNIQLGGDICRRCVWIRLDSKQAKPHERDGFLHPNLLQWVLKNRGRLLTALLTLSRAWYADGCLNYPVPVFGSFEAWAQTVGCILAHAGVTGFLENRDTLWEQSDTESTEWERFLAAWRKAYGSSPVTPKRLLQDIEADKPIAEALPASLSDAVCSSGDPCSRIGYQFRMRLGKRYGSAGMRLERGDRQRNGNPWVVLVDDEAPAPESGSTPSIKYEPF